MAKMVGGRLLNAILASQGDSGRAVRLLFLGKSSVSAVSMALRREAQDGSE